MSEITEQQEQEQDSQLTQDLPGKRLMEAREAAGMTCGDVASQMRLNERMVRALEEDDYSAFPSATFVSGYLRSYARVLGLPEDDFVKPVVESIEPPSLVSTVGSKAQVSSSDLPVRLVTWLLVVVVIISVSMWWLSQREKGQEILPTIQQESVQPEDKIDLSLPEKAEHSGETDSQVNTGSDEAAQGGKSEAKTEESVVEKTPEPVKEEASKQPAVEQDVADAAGDGKDKAKAPPPLTAATPASKLELRYQADSWTEVTDAAGRQLVYGLIKAGQDLQLRGEAPFKVFLGYAPGVTVYYNNDLFDHSPFQRRDVARFRIGRAEHNLPGSR